MKRPKYGNRKVAYGGHTFDSQKEADYYKTLLWLRKSGEVTDIQLQPKFGYVAVYTSTVEWINNTYTKPGFYLADFKVTYSDGHVEIIDVKGMRTAEYKRKKKIVEALYGIKIIEK